MPCERSWLAWRRVDPVATRRPPSAPAPSARELRIAPKGPADESTPNPPKGPKAGCGGAGAHGSACAPLRRTAGSDEEGRTVVYGAAAAARATGLEVEARAPAR